MDEPFFDRFFGEWGQRVHQLIRGIDDRVVTSDHEAKSISQEQTFHDNIHDLDVLRDVLLEQVEDAAALCAGRVGTVRAFRSRSVMRISVRLLDLGSWMHRRM